jgi:hypothetical protein
MKLQDDIKRMHKRSLIYLTPKSDDRYEVLFKHFETLKNQDFALKELARRMATYQND